MKGWTPIISPTLRQVPIPDVNPDDYSVITDFNPAEDQLNIEYPRYLLADGTYTAAVAVEVEVVAHADGAAVQAVGTFVDGTSITRIIAVLEGVDAATFDMSSINSEQLTPATDGNDHLRGGRRG